MKQNPKCRYPECADKEEYCSYFQAICCQHDKFVKTQNKRETPLAVDEGRGPLGPAPMGAVTGATTYFANSVNSAPAHPKRRAMVSEEMIEVVSLLRDLFGDGASIRAGSVFDMAFRGAAACNSPEMQERFRRAEKSLRAAIAAMQSRPDVDGLVEELRSLAERKDEALNAAFDFLGGVDGAAEIRGAILQALSPRLSSGA